jgi:quercetin dioxygenase-like cupin family protein
MVAAGSALTLAAAAWTPVGAQTAKLTSQVWDWTTMKVVENKTGARRDVVRAPTITLDELEMHITTLRPGETSHPPHQHLAEELLIIKEGTVEALVNGEQKRIGPGSIIFQASNQLHGIRNVGTTAATYHVIQWQSPGMLKK